MQTLHRVRDRLVAERTSLMNQIRSLLLERGITIPQGRAKLNQRLSELRQAPDQVSPRMQLLLRDLHERLLEITARIRTYDAEFTAQAQADERARRLMAIPGIGALNATALVAAIGTGETFGRARDLAAWLGLVPRQATTGGKPRLLGITKRGNAYLRRLFVQGARAAWVWKDKHPDDPLQRWLIEVGQRRHAHVAICALANKLARIAWAVMTTGQDYLPRYSRALANA